MKSSSLLVLAVLLAISPAWVSAESIMNKCTDGQQITYTDKPCAKLGLKDAGPISNTVTEIIATPANYSDPNNQSHADETPKAKTNGPVKQMLDKLLN